MTGSEFRKLALALPDAGEGEHMGHPDFRVHGKIFATLSPDEAWAMAKLTPVQQTDFLAMAPEMFEPIPGAWGRQGCTRVILKKAYPTQVRQALQAAWGNIPAKAKKKKANLNDSVPPAQPPRRKKND